MENEGSFYFQIQLLHSIGGSFYYFFFIIFLIFIFLLKSHWWKANIIRVHGQSVLKGFYVIDKNQFFFVLSYQSHRSKLMTFDFREKEFATFGQDSV